MHRGLLITTVAALLALPLAGTLRGQQEKAEVALRAAIEQETVRGDLKGAIEQYRTIIDRHRDNRAVTVQALLRMAECYSRLGDAEAAAIHGKISPDGRYLSYETEDLYVHDFSTSSSRQLTKTGPRPVEHAEYPEGSAFSRDSRRLAYAWRVRARGIYQIRVVDVSGSGIPDARILLEH